MCSNSYFQNSQWNTLWKKISNLLFILFPFQHNHLHEYVFLFFFLVYMYLHLNFMIFKHVRYLHLSPLYPDEHPFKQFPLIKWHWSSRKQCPHSWRQLGPKVPVGHSYNAMNVILEYYSFWIVFIFCNKLLFKLNFNFFQNTNLNCFLWKKKKHWMGLPSSHTEGSLVWRPICSGFNCQKP